MCVCNESKATAAARHEVRDSKIMTSASKRPRHDLTTLLLQFRENTPVRDQAREVEQQQSSHQAVEGTYSQDLWHNFRQPAWQKQTPAHKNDPRVISKHLQRREERHQQSARIRMWTFTKVLICAME